MGLRLTALPGRMVRVCDLQEILESCVSNVRHCLGYMSVRETYSVSKWLRAGASSVQIVLKSRRKRKEEMIGAKNTIQDVFLSQQNGVDMKVRLSRESKMFRI